MPKQVDPELGWTDAIEWRQPPTQDEITPLIAGRLLDRDDLDVRKVRRTYDLKGIGRTSILAVRTLSDVAADQESQRDWPKR